MRTRLAFCGAILAGLATFASACGNGPDKPGTPTPGTTAPRGAQTAAPYGPAPKLGGNITAITPGHAEKVAQQSTRTTNPAKPNGVCFSVSFDGTPEYGQWFRMALDDQEVTTKLVWIVPSQNAPTTGRACYAPVEGIAAGRHTAAVSVQNPRNPTEPTRQIVAWAFEVTP
jgi:hypothetical protein